MSKTLSICPKCHSLNNILRDKSEDARCGKCGSGFNMHGAVTEVSADGLQRILDKSDQPVIVDFWASWCGPCRVYGPEFEKASLENNQAVFLKINTEENQQLSARLGVRSIPTTIIFHRGKEVARQSGSLPRQMIHQMVEQIKT